MADISQINVNNTTYDLKDSKAKPIFIRLSTNKKLAEAIVTSDWTIFQFEDINGVTITHSNAYACLLRGSPLQMRLYFLASDSSGTYDSDTCYLLNWYYDSAHSRYTIINNYQEPLLDDNGCSAGYWSLSLYFNAQETCILEAMDQADTKYPNSDLIDLSKIEYDNTTSGLVATNAQDAIDEVVTNHKEVYINMHMDSWHPRTAYDHIADVVYDSVTDKYGNTLTISQAKSLIETGTETYLNLTGQTNHPPLSPVTVVLPIISTDIDDDGYLYAMFDMHNNFIPKMSSIYVIKLTANSIAMTKGDLISDLDCFVHPDIISTTASDVTINTSVRYIGTQLNVKNANIDVTKSNNNISSTQYPGMYISDGLGVTIGKCACNVNTNGSVNIELYAKNKGTGSEVTNALQLRVANDGTRSVGVSDSAIWRSAIGAGIPASITSNNPSSLTTKSIANSASWSNLGSVSLAAGIYLVMQTVRWNARAAGYRKICISTTSSGSQISVGHMTMIPASPNDITVQELVCVLNPTGSSNTPYYFQCAQYDGTSTSASIDAQGRYTILKLA